jgi:hypothetical protein
LSFKMRTRRPSANRARDIARLTRFVVFEIGFATRHGERLTKSPSAIAGEARAKYRSNTHFGGDQRMRLGVN